jgi:uncharacterized protein (UPF0147 family)
MKLTNPHHILAASYRRLAKTLRVRSANYKRAAKLVAATIPEQAKDLNLRALTAIDLADELEHDARLLRAKEN